MPRRLVPLLMVAAMTVGLAACKHPAGPYGWPTPDGWAWTDTCHGYSVTDPATATICVDPGQDRHRFIAAHELAHAWDHTLGTFPYRSFVEAEELGDCVAELLTGEASEGWWAGVYHGRPHGCTRTGQVWADTQLLYLIIVG